MSTTPSTSPAASKTELDGADLGSGLKTRHLTMMGLGSAIGAGLFLGTGVGISIAGPAVLLAYVAAGIIVVFVMQMLGEMAAARPASGAFASYAQMAFGHWAGFSLGWLYWFMLIMVMGAEMTGAAAIMAGWFGTDPWIPALVCVALFAVINLMQVKGFGEFEFWFAFIKLAVIVLFLVVAVLMVFGLLPGHSAVGTKNFIGEHGFMPNGITGVAAGLLAVAFAFGGIEIVTIAAAESENPSEAIAAATRSVVWRISLFYLGSVLAICFLLPYDKIGGAQSAAESPFTIILRDAGIPLAAPLMEIVIVLALLSAFNAQIYGTSRLVYSHAVKGDAPKFFGRLNRFKVPNNAVLLSMFFAFVSVGLQYWNPAGLLEFLLNAVGGCLVVIWLMICFSHLKLHREMEANGELSVRMWGFPVLPWLTVAALLGLTVLMLFEPSTRSQITSVALVYGALVALSFVIRAVVLKRRAGQEAGTETGGA